MKLLILSFLVLFSSFAISSDVIEISQFTEPVKLANCDGTILVKHEWKRVEVKDAGIFDEKVKTVKVLTVELKDVEFCNFFQIGFDEDFEELGHTQYQRLAIDENKDLRFGTFKVTIRDFRSGLRSMWDALVFEKGPLRADYHLKVVNSLNGTEDRVRITFAVPSSHRSTSDAMTEIMSHSPSKFYGTDQNNRLSEAYKRAGKYMIPKSSNSSYNDKMKEAYKKAYGSK